jgi:hypothetical protein
MLTNDGRVSTLNGFPSRLIFLKKYIDGVDRREISFVLSLLNYSKGIILNKEERPKPDYSPITMKGKAPVYIPKWFLFKFVDDFRLALPKPQHAKEDFFINMAIGPGGPSVLSIFRSIFCLNIVQLERICRLLSDENLLVRFYKTMVVNFSKLPFNPAISKGVFSSKKLWNSSGRLAIVTAPEGKERVIAISDYFTQFTLKPINYGLMRLLKKFPGDRTFTQSPFHNWKGCDKFYSFDLTAATDRFPAEMQRRLIAVVYNDVGFSWDWYNLLIDRGYLSPEGKLLFYAVGQPMGSHSSWSAFSLTHHLVIQWAAYLCGKYPFHNYIMLGDDIVIRDNAVAARYTTIIRRLGVSISQQKTHVSKDTYEFAKRWIFRGNEVTGLPLAGISQNIKSPKIVLTILLDWILKGNTSFHHGNLATLVKDCYKGVRILTKGKGKNIKFIPFTNVWLNTSLQLFYLSLRLAHGLLTEDEARGLLAEFSADRPEYVMPSKDGCLAELARVISLRVTTVALNSIKRTSNLVKSLQSNELHNVLPVSPILYGVINHIEQVITTKKSFANMEFTLHDVVRKIVLIDSNAMLAWDRNSIKVASIAARIFKQALKQLTNENSEVYKAAISDEYSFMRLTMLNVDVSSSQVLSLQDLKEIANPIEDEELGEDLAPETEYDLYQDVNSPCIRLGDLYHSEVMPPQGSGAKEVIVWANAHGSSIL